MPKINLNVVSLNSQLGINLLRNQTYLALGFHVLKPALPHVIKSFYAHERILMLRT
jgi:hypothetical protein